MWPHTTASKPRTFSSSTSSTTSRKSSVIAPVGVDAPDTDQWARRTAGVSAGISARSPRAAATSIAAASSCVLSRSPPSRAATSRDTGVHGSVAIEKPPGTYAGHTSPSTMWITSGRFDSRAVCASTSSAIGRVRGLDIVVPGDRDERRLELDERVRPGEHLGRRRPAAVEHVAGEQHRVDLVLVRELHDHREHVLLIAQPVARLAPYSTPAPRCRSPKQRAASRATTRSECSSSTWSTYQTSSCQASCPSRFRTVGRSGSPDARPA
jgi:hypothetical protein